MNIAYVDFNPLRAAAMSYLLLCHAIVWHYITTDT